MPQATEETNKTLLKVLKDTLGLFLKYKYHTSAENLETLNLEPPYVLLANHTIFWDPFLLSYTCPSRSIMWPRIPISAIHCSMYCCGW